MANGYVRIVRPHEDLPDSDYHEWISFGERVRADRLGRPHPRIISAEWVKWICNEPSCDAWALVKDDAVRALLDAAASSDSGAVQ